MKYVRRQPAPEAPATPAPTVPIEQLATQVSEMQEAMAVLTRAVQAIPDRSPDVLRAIEAVKALQERAPSKKTAYRMTPVRDSDGLIQHIDCTPIQ